MLNLEIKKIDIKDFGCYKDYKQHSQSGIGNDFNDGRVNIFMAETILEKVLIRKFFKVLNLSNFQKSTEI